MSDDREKLLRIMNSLEADYRSGKISAEKYSYFRSKYEDKLNAIDAQEATRRIRSMQGKPSSNDHRIKRSRKPAENKKKEEEDLVQKYIINPKKDDAKYNKKERFSMDSGTFKLLLILILVVGFTVGVAYGFFGNEFNSVVETTSSAVVADTAFPEVEPVIVKNTTTTTSSYNSSGSDDSSDTSSDDIDVYTYSSSSDSSYSSSDYGSSDYSQGSSSSSSSSSSYSDSGSSSYSDSGSSSSSESGGGSESGSEE